MYASVCEYVACACVYVATGNLSPIAVVKRCRICIVLAYPRYTQCLNTQAAIRICLLKYPHLHALTGNTRTHTYTLTHTHTLTTPSHLQVVVGEEQSVAVDGLSQTPLSPQTFPSQTFQIHRTPLCLSCMQPPQRSPPDRP